MDRTDPPPPEADIVVVGGGILGLATARELVGREAGISICLLESESRLAAHQTTHSSGVVHAGIYYEPGSLRARLCVDGAARMRDYCRARGIPLSRSGKLIVATDRSELDRLDQLEQRGRANGVSGLARIAGEGIKEIEPAASGIAALHSPETSVVDFGEVALGFASDFESGGGTIHLASRVSAVRTGPGGPGGGSTGPGHPGNHALVIETDRGAVKARRAVFCGGLQSDRLARMCGGSAGPRIVPFRGGYLRIKPGRESLVRGNVYPVPDPGLPFLGAHLTRTTDGTVLIGPTAMIAGARDAYRLGRIRRHDLADTVAWPGTWRLLGRHWRAAGHELRNSLSPASLVREAARLVPGLTTADVLPGPSGVRAQAVGRDGRLVEDFLLEETGPSIHVRNAPSPAATSSMAIASLIADRVQAGA